MRNQSDIWKSILSKSVLFDTFTSNLAQSCQNCSFLTLSLSDMLQKYNPFSFSPTVATITISITQIISAIHLFMNSSPSARTSKLDLLVPYFSSYYFAFHEFICLFSLLISKKHILHSFSLILAPFLAENRCQAPGFRHVDVAYFITI